MARGRPIKPIKGSGEDAARLAELRRRDRERKRKERREEFRAKRVALSPDVPVEEVCQTDEPAGSASEASHQ